MSATTPPSSVLTVPNLVSSSRFVLAAGFLVADGTAWRIGLLGVASLTDFLDGWLARRARLTSRLGALLDPVADRVFVLAVVVSFLASGELQPWQAVALLFRDVMSLIGWFVARSSPALRAIPFRARWPGKVLTALQLFVFLAALLWPALVTPLVIAAAVLGVGATVDYTLMLWRERRVEAEGA
jgi:cardiolipin synthase (CMP-forming)